MSVLLCVFNQLNPPESFYSESPKKCADYFWGKNIEMYSLIFCDDYGVPLGFVKAVDLPGEITELRNKIEKMVDGYTKIMVEYTY